VHKSLKLTSRLDVLLILSYTLLSGGQHRKAPEQGKLYTAMSENKKDRIRTSSEDTEAEPTKRLNAEIPASMHSSFKAKAAKEGKKMTNVVRELIVKYLSE